MKRGDLQREGAAPPRSGGELARMARPVLGGVGFVLRVYHWPILVLLALYLASGATTVKPGEVALVLRFGELTGDTRAEQVHRPGFLFALPAPIDEVVRVDVEAVRSLRLEDLTYGLGPLRGGSARQDTINPEQDGYCLTGDRNVLQTLVVARYRVSDPVAWTLEHAEPEHVLGDAILSAVVQTIGEMSIELILREEGRTALPRASLARAQAECDGRGLGVELLALELPDLQPPTQVSDAFRQVMDAAIVAVTVYEEASRYQATELPAARAEARRILADARTSAGARVARARGEADAFRALVSQPEEEGDLLRVRLYREALERALDGVRLRVLPPPAEGERYDDFRITLPF